MMRGVVVPLCVAFLLAFAAGAAAKPLKTHTLRPITTASDRFHPHADGAEGVCRALEHEACSVVRGCVWCAGGSEGACYSQAQQVALPRGAFECETVVEHAGLGAASTCGAKTQDACDKNSDCTWCKSAAVPSSCYTKTEAAKLPSAVFVCD